MSRSGGFTALPPGTYVKTDGLFIAQDGLAEGDEILDSYGNYWEVKGVHERAIGDGFLHRECDLTLLQYHI